MQNNTTTKHTKTTNNNTTKKIKMDARIEQIFNESMQGDTSFQEKPSVLSLIFGTTKYSGADMKKTWNLGIKHGIEIGLRKASIEGQIIELNNNAKNERHKEFLDKFSQLANEYKCAIQYHPQKGMVIIDQQH